MIRKFRTDDLEQVMELWLATNISAHDFISAKYWHANYALVKEMLPQANIWVYEKNNEIWGFIGLQDTYIAGIFVADKAQGKGIGSELLAKAKQQKSQLSLAVYAKNERALNFYQRADFTVVNEQLDETIGQVEYLMKWQAS
ncbi:N-acetyltransferase [Ligilactobacillus murinus]|uniref:N-acetyltransferase n=1 Tax=Ligilactobacillus murinus TaxID=1622 RepID=A0AAE7BR17_9LACO|nr:N-acetyltransferase [Ligilactobacillus murinus]NEF82934.1 N-acetyltransferase [Ligilactobacillus murinus]NEF85558.1 N-acetyltransferase [Ligilactobacillus murinus]NEF87508.1 N-acetyltransferase [Ligilactobacillus murinus]NEF89833.1 N-acetyltransferase [Ligilactobacillus murinus]NEF92094.1 N-acetyltransferase [Ligilactobacillus murinus]